LESTLPFLVYIIQNDLSGKIYIGQTSNIEKRMEAHNDKESGRRKYTTKQDDSWHLIHSEEMETRSQAMQFLKSGQGREWIMSALLWNDSSR